MGFQKYVCSFMILNLKETHLCTHATRHNIAHVHSNPIATVIYSMRCFILTPNVTRRKYSVTSRQVAWDLKSVCYILHIASALRFTRHSWNLYLIKTFFFIVILAFFTCELEARVCYFIYLLYTIYQDVAEYLFFIPLINCKLFLSHFKIENITKESK